MECWRREGLRNAMPFALFERDATDGAGVVDVPPINVRHFVDYGGADDVFA